MAPSALRGSSAVGALIGVVGGWFASFNARLALGVLAGVAVAILVLVGAEILLLGVVSLEPWAEALTFPSATVTIPKIAGLLTLASWLIATATGRAPLRYVPQIGWAFGFVFLVVLSLMLSPDPAAGVTKSVSYVLYACFLTLFVQLMPGREKVERCLAVYAGSAMVAAVDGLIEFLAGHAGRAAIPGADPNDFAFMLAGALPLALYFAFNAPKLRWLWKLAAVLLAGAMLATLSRGAAVGFGAVLIWAVVSRRISMPGLFAAVVAVLAVVSLLFVFFHTTISERLVQKSVVADKNVASRQVFWSAAWQMSLDHPVVGVGPGRFGAESQNYVLNNPIVLQNPVVHNSYLEILAEDGPFALALFLCFLLSVWRGLREARRAAMRRRDLAGQRLATALQASFVWTLVSALFVSRQLSIPIWLIGGLAGALALAWRREPATATSPSGLSAQAAHAA